MIAPIPTAPIGAASPNCPTTPVSTAPRMGTVTLARRMGSAILRTRLWVITPGSGSNIPARHQEMARRLREGAGAIVLPRLDMNAGIPATGTRHLGAGIGIARQTRAQVINRKIDGFGQSRQLALGKLFRVKPPALHLVPEQGPTKCNDRRDLQKGRRRPPV